jgi:hypothetical protein
MQENIEKKNELNENTNNKTENKKFTLSIDYSKFQPKFNNSNNINIGNEILKKDSNISNYNNFIKEENYIISNDEKIHNNPAERKNFDHFLNISGLLDDSQISSIDIRINDKNDQEQKFNNTNSNKMNQNILSNCLDDLTISTDNEPKLLSTNIMDTIKKNNNNKKNENIDLENKKRENSYNNKNIRNNIPTPINAVKKKNKYAKFINSRNNDNDNDKKINYTNEKNAIFSPSKKNEKNKSYAQMMKNGHNLNENYSKNNTSFNLFNGVNTLHNKSNFSDISYNALSTATGDLNETSRKRNRTKNKTSTKDNNLYSNFNQRYNLKTQDDKNIFNYEDINKKQAYSNKNKKYETFKNELKQYNINSANRYINSSNKYNNNNDNVQNILDNIKNKYKRQENKYMSQQRSMKNEINILKEKLKKLSVNEALYQVEIEKLKRNKKDSLEMKKYTEKNEININKGNISNPIVFEEKLDNLIQKYNNSDTNNNNNIESSCINNNKNKSRQLIELFDIDKDIFEGENIFDENDNINYEEVMNKYPMIKKFIQILINKYKKEKDYRIRLEEKTIEIFTNDIKRINYLEKKIKTYEAEKHLRVNSSLNYSYDNDLFEENANKNFDKSCDKSS